MGYLRPILLRRLAGAGQALHRRTGEIQVAVDAKWARKD